MGETCTTIVTHDVTQPANFIYASIMEDCAFYTNYYFSISRATLSQGIFGHGLTRDPEVGSVPAPLKLSYYCISLQILALFYLASP